MILLLRGPWLAARAGLEAVVGRPRLDRWLNAVGFFRMKNALLRRRRALPDGGSIILRHEDERVVPEVYDGPYKEAPIGETDTIVDVGAHIGVFTLRAARLAKRGRIVSIEPSPNNRGLLLENLKLNGVVNATVVACATSDHEGEGELRWPGDSGLSTLDPSAPAVYTFQVRVRTLDSILRELGVGKVDLLKLDNEWSEYATLIGASETLKRTEQILVEIGRRGEEPGRTIALIEASGFSCRVLLDTPGGVVAHARRR